MPIEITPGVVFSPGIVIGGAVEIPPAVLLLDAENYAGSGTTWTASVGPNAVLVNSPVYTADSPTYFTFNGVNQYAELLHNSVFKPTAAITMEQWITADDWTAGDPINYFASLSCTQGGGYAHYIWQGVFRSYVRTGAVYQIPSADVSSFAPGSWHHSVTTFDGQYTRLYLDGVLANTVDMGTAGNSITYDPDNSLLIAAEATGTVGAAGQYWPGRVALTSIRSVALTAVQVSALYAANQSRFAV